MKIAYQGEIGSFSEIIGDKLFEDAKFLACKTFKDVFDKVKKGLVEKGIIPIENTLTGRICESTDLLISSNLKICDEGMLQINHCLITNHKGSIKNIKRIYAHPEALAQCKNFLRKINCELISWYDGAAAVKIVKNKFNSALVASEKVAKIYNLKILKKGIQDSKKDITRFIVISKENSPITVKDKTALVFSLCHKSGSLYNALESFSIQNINLTRLESMPSKNKPWEYLFLVDFEGHNQNDNVKRALRELKKHTLSMKNLGSYPCFNY